MIQYDFDEIVERRGTDCLKYDKLKDLFGKADLMPFWVADMDFRTPDFIVDALKKRCEHPVFGYTFPPAEYFPSIIRWIKHLYKWDVREEWLSYIPGIVKGIGLALECFTEKGDKVIIQPPVYHPFRIVPEKLNREVVYNPLRQVNGVYEMDFEHLEAVADNGCRALILSSPHNPAGIVWDGKTLQRLAEICRRRSILVIADEIHSEMTFPGFEHHPFPTVSDDAAACSITFMAPSKTFNIAGIVSSYAIVPDDSLRRAFYSFLEACELHEGTIFSYIATVAAYVRGDEWRRQMLEYVKKNILFAEEYVRAHIPQIKVYRPQASFLIWLDCRDLKMNQQELFALVCNGAGLALNNGTMFGREGEGYLRMNVGCPRAMLRKGLEALKNTLSIEKVDSQKN
ncbi:MAG: PatB family C-S lyase [Tannerella sp.]|jgi:cystathionine beta-lyase|nr:PatB family C-S lyase [Tannerella sp.]